MLEPTRLASREQVLETLAQKRDLSGANLTAADLTNSILRWVDVAGADLTKATLSGARAGRVDWSAAKVPPTELPGSLPTPPPWLPVLLGCIGAVLVVAALKRKAASRRWRNLTVANSSHSHKEMTE